MVHYERLPGESDDQLFRRMASEKDTVGTTWQDIADEMNRLTGQYHTESKYRKTWNRNVQLTEPSSPVKMLDRDMEQAKIQYRDERNSWQRQNYIAARATQKLDYLEEELQNIGRMYFTNKSGSNVESDNDLLVVLSDLHIGQAFDTAFGMYNPDVATSRMGQYFHRILDIAETHEVQDLYVVLCGDLISGNIHKSIQVSNRENVIQQIKTASELISSFVADLAPHFAHVYVTGVSGNHSRMDKKDEAMHDERLDDLILWITKALLKNVGNITVTEPNIDTGIANIEIRNQSYVAVHGDWDKNTDARIGKLAMMLGFVPEHIIMGHLHYCELTECNGVQIIRGGSLAGSGDQFTVERRLTGKPKQMCCVCNDKGVVAAYPVDLS